MTKYEALFTPFQIGSQTIKNRVVLTAMGGSEPIKEAEDHYEFNEGVVEYYRNRAKGNIGLMIPGVIKVWLIEGNTWLYEYPELFTGPLKSLVNDIHAHGSKFFLQLGQGFGRSHSADPAKQNDPETLRVNYAAGDGVPNVWNPAYKHRGLTVPEIDDLVEGFAKAAVLCKEAGVDGVELHAVHEGYLFDQFAISSMNPRTDEYGGSLENRMRFVTRVIKAIKAACGEDYPVLVRYSVASKMRGFNAGAVPGEDYVEFGRSMEESPAVARALEAAGCDGLDADNGCYDAWWWTHPPVYMPLSCNLPEVSYIKHFVNIPVICGGRMENPETANAAIAGGVVDGIGIARQFLCDAEYLNKVYEGRLEDIRPCIACHNGCFAIGGIKDPDGNFEFGTCALNPFTKHEKKYALTKAETPKKVVVVGGGIAGMEVARMAALRGHKVLLYEKTDVLGGVFRAAAAPDFKEKDKMFIDWCIHALKQTDAEIHMNTEMTPELLKSLGADEIILATGAAPRKLRLPGFEKGIEAIDFLLGRKTAAGDRIAVIGGGLTGCEIAYDLARKGKKPVIIEMQDQILKVPGLSAANANLLKELIRYHKIGVQTGASLKEIRDDGVVCTVDGEDVFFPADAAILSVGYVPVDQSKLVEGLDNVHVLGDASRVKNLKSVIWGAWDLAFSL